MIEIVALLLLSQRPFEPVAEGVASYYTIASSSSLTASGETFDEDAYTCAMREGEFGAHYLVVGADGASVIVRLNDRGPYVKRRVIDLSEAAMRRLHPTKGLARVKVYKLDVPKLSDLPGIAGIPVPSFLDVSARWASPPEEELASQPPRAPLPEGAFEVTSRPRAPLPQPRAPLPQL